MQRLDIIANIKTKINGNITYSKWLKHVLSVSRVGFYDDMNDEDKYAYDTYVEVYEKDVKEFRAASSCTGWIILHNNNETLQSLSWLLLHELGHQWANQCADIFGYNLFAELSGGRSSSLSKENQKRYTLDDNYREARYEEQFANNIANTIMGENYDRHWWRKNCYKKGE